MEVNINNPQLQNVEKVEVVYNKETVNRFLSEGWVILAIGTGQEQTGQHDYTPMFAYCLGKLKQ
jgi:hypothetical protein